MSNRATFNGFPESYSDQTGSPGNCTSHTRAGKCAVADGQQTVTVTCSLCTTSSGIVATLNNSGSIPVRDVEPGNGSFVIRMTAAVAGDTPVAWTFVSPPGV